MTRRKFLGLAAASVAIGAGGAAVAKKIKREVVITHHTAPLEGTGGLRVVHITDPHIGLGTRDELLDEVVEHCKRAEPDLVVLTGDYLNHSLRQLGRVRRFVAALSRPCVATLGNHDYWSGAAEIQTALAAEGVTVLRNHHVSIECGGKGEITVVGVDDSFTRHDDVEAAFDGLANPQQALCLTHYPNSADSMADHGARLILAGHTHGGQMDVPIITTTVARTIGNRYLAGWYDVGQARLYVNVGIGSSIGCPRVGERVAPEIAIIDLVEPEVA